MRFGLLQDFAQLKLQILQFVPVFLFVDGAGLLFRLEIGNAVDQFVFSFADIFATLLSRKGLSVQLQRVTDTPQKKSSDKSDNEPRVRTHSIGHVRCARSFILHKEQ